MNESKIQNLKSKIFLGVDGGQSHTEAVIADETGVVLGRGFGGESNHAEFPGGRTRLQKAIRESVGGALRDAAQKTEQSDENEISAARFKSAHFGMTGGAKYKQEIIGEIIKADYFTVGHDAPTALFGATAGESGIVVIAGTGSVVYGENRAGETAKIGGLGYLFSDEGSGFWLAAQVVRLAIKEQDGLIEPAGLESLVTNFFERTRIRDVTDDFYNGKITRERLASFARRACEAATAGNVIIQNQIEFGARVLVESVASAAKRLNFQSGFPVAGVGGMFRASLMKRRFAESLAEKIPAARVVEPRFNPAIGALLLAFRQAEIAITEDLLINLERSAEQKRPGAKQE